MKQGTKNDLMLESQIFADAWTFIKTYMEPESDEDWQIVVDAAKAFPKQYPGKEKFATDLILSVINQIERTNAYMEMQKRALREAS